MEKLLNYKDAKIYVRKMQNKSEDQADNGQDGDDSFDSFHIGVSKVFTLININWQQPRQFEINERNRKKNKIIKF